MAIAMQVLKDKVADKLSNLLADSPVSSPNHIVPQHIEEEEEPILPSDPPKAKPLSTKEESYTSQKSLSLSSYLYSFLPTASSDGQRSNKCRTDYRKASLPTRWRSKSFSWKEKSLDSNEEHVPSGKTTLETCKENESEGDVVEKNINDSDDQKGASTSPLSVKSMPDLLDDSTFISPVLFEFLQSCLPNIVKGCQWALLYSTAKDGISLRTLLRKSMDLPGPCLLIAGDKQGAVFGGLLQSPLRPTSKRKYQGTNETFVFTTIFGQPTLFPATGANRYYYLCLNDLLALGGGGNFALSLDEDLLRGTSGPCETYGNLCLANSQEFELKNVELWGFTHSSRYLN